VVSGDPGGALGVFILKGVPCPPCSSECSSDRVGIDARNTGLSGRAPCASRTLCEAGGMGWHGSGHNLRDAAFAFTNGIVAEWKLLQAPD